MPENRPRKGQRVRIPKGTIILGTFADGIKEAGRTYTVKVDHVLGGYPGCCYCNGHMDDQWDASRPAFPHRDGHQKHCYPPAPTRVRWAGTGGYWHEADLSDVEILDD